MSDTAILIVEDEVIVATDLARKLGCLGYTVCGCTISGEDALALAREQHPNLVLMDISLAGKMDGVEAAEHIRRECDVPVIYLTAHADRTTLDRAKRTEAFRYILKPFDEREMETHIEIALYKHRAERKLRENEQALRHANMQVEQILESITDAFVSIDHEWRYVYVNEQAAQLLGKTRD